jgi:hypothetical protein
MPGGNLAPGRTATYDLTEPLMKQLKANPHLDVVKAKVIKKKVKKSVADKT